jgi:hypothetical protein
MWSHWHALARHSPGPTILPSARRLLKRLLPKLARLGIIWRAGNDPVFTELAIKGPLPRLHSASLCKPSAAVPEHHERIFAQLAAEGSTPHMCHRGLLRKPNAYRRAGAAASGPDARRSPDIREERLLLATTQTAI